MRVLGIETSCDETAAAVVAVTDDPARPWVIRSNVVASQAAIHREWGGVVPEIASRQHVRDICGVVERALDEADATLADIDAIAVTQGPGLVGALLVGVSFAKAMGAALGTPVVPVHHLAGHIESLFLDHGSIPLPALVLVVSGGHTSVYVVPAPGVYQLVGRTRDDAAGEAYDKVAKLLGLGYPGGPVIDRLARDGRPDAVELPRPRFTHADRHATPALVVAGRTPGTLPEFSFSGLKTAVLRYLALKGVGPAGPGRETASGHGLSPEETADVAASFQRVVVDSLLDRTFEAARAFGACSVGISGGVSANSALRREAARRGEQAGLPVFVPRLSLSTDNAAMIAAAGLRALELGRPVVTEFSAVATLPIF